MTTIEISGTQDIRNAPCLIEVDEFVPLRFRTYERPIGAAYVRVGNYSTTLVELIVDPISKLLRGLTLTSFECFAVFPTIREAASSRGLPALSVDWGQHNRIDIERDFFVSIRNNALLIGWGHLHDLSERTVFGRAEFLIAKNELRGVRFCDLTKAEVTLLAGHAHAIHEQQ